MENEFYNYLITNAYIINYVDISKLDKKYNFTQEQIDMLYLLQKFDFPESFVIETLYKE